MSATTAKANVERELVEVWQTLASAVDSFSDAELERPGVVEGWSVKDLLGHIAFWAQRAAHNLQAVAAVCLSGTLILRLQDPVGYKPQAHGHHDQDQKRNQKHAPH